MKIPEEIKRRLSLLYDEQELIAVFRVMIAHICRIPYAHTRSFQGEFTDEENWKLNEIMGRLENAEPIQYILNEVPFMGINLFVNSHTLIPRPETEELVDWIVQDFKKQSTSIKIVDFGTGSGCIALAIKKYIPQHEMYAVDVSEQALEIAKYNAQKYHLDVQFLQDDILQLQFNSKVDVIVSNPPYIHQSEAALMENNVLCFEPHLALFVAHQDPIIFYKKIIDYAQSYLNHFGIIYFEINPDFSVEIEKYLDDNGFEFIIRQDMQGRNRMLKAKKSVDLNKKAIHH